MNRKGKLIAPMTGIISARRRCVECEPPPTTTTTTTKNRRKKWCGIAKHNMNTEQIVWYAPIYFLQTSWRRRWNMLRLQFTVRLQQFSNIPCWCGFISIAIFLYVYSCINWNRFLPSFRCSSIILTRKFIISMNVADVEPESSDYLLSPPPFKFFFFSSFTRRDRREFIQ